MAEKKKSKLDQVLDEIRQIKTSLQNQSLKLLNQDLKFDSMDKKIDHKFNEVLTGQDKIMKELEAGRQEKTASMQKDRTQDNKIGALEMRMRTVEEKVGVS